MDELRELDVWIGRTLFSLQVVETEYGAFVLDKNGLMDISVEYELSAYSSILTHAWTVLQECQRHHVYLQIEAAMPQGYYGWAQIAATADKQGFSASAAPELICYMAKWAYEKLGADGWRDSVNPVYKVM